ncbi:ABC transporter-like [Moorella glycerini]|uniref:Lipopolysaccharide export system ATP-binding protein LptB n=1 Tax=Neomoorella stamsii TaxID=1266720 RepID=A0A9X7J3A3_9FIRM|nr:MULTISPECIES: ABC transporter ATP-binding protein [Moorella]PRR73442.1 Lipopolysaccharide export system ATP-binding protein LptB [Moorella stamsii]CEP69211.1 ABC transporter-like [Moorella glycerini]
MEVLRTEALTINFGGLKAVDGVDFTIGDEIVGLIGPNGSGKTTFLNLVSGIYQPTSGKIIFQQEDITGAGPDIIRSKGIARTFQTNRLCLNLSVIDNMLLGLYSQQKTTWWQAIFQPAYCRAEIKASIEKCFQVLAHFNAELIKKCYDPITTIPLIDRRRIEIARAIVGEPRLLLLDEPTAGLNAEETIQMIRDIGKIRESNRQISIIIIEHDMSVIARITDRVVVLNAGKKIAEGLFSEVSKDEQVRTAYLGG